MNAKLTNMQSNTTKELNIQTKIGEIKLDNFHLEKSILSGKKLNLENFQYEFNVNMNVNTSKKEITVNLIVNIYSDKEKKNKIGNINSHGVFIVYNLAEIIKASEGKIPNIILANFIGVVISTTRGFLIDKSLNTPIDGAIIPMVSPLTFFPK